MKKALLDTNVVLDVFLVRKPFLESSEKIIELCFQKKIQGFVTPLSIATAHYIFAKVSGKNEALKKVSELLTVIGVLAMNENTVVGAICSRFDDFEDALQNQAAESSKMDLILTRNLKDYKKSTLTVMDPEGFLKAF